MNLVARSLLALLAPAPPTASEETSSPIATILARDLRSHVEFLACDELEGREAGTAAERLAARYLATRLEALGLEPGGDDGGFFQDFEIGEKPMRNVIALLRGTDPERAGETVVVGAHYDHVGRGGAGGRGRGEIHNGADDNASGTAVVLELAEAFSRRPPPRTIAFALFTAEEKGLRGSARYVANPPRPLETTVAMLNLDMVGRSRDGYLFVGGVGTAPEWNEIVDRATEGTGLRLEKGEAGSAPSDNTSFYRKGIPVLFLFTHVHEDYHAPGDDPEKLDYEATQRIARVAFRIVEEVASRPGRLEFRKAPGLSVPKDFVERMMALAPGAPNRPKVGVVPDPDHEGPGILVRSLTPGGGAEEAGLLAGDTILALDGKKTDSLADLLRALDGKETGDTVVVRARREERTIEVEVPLRP